MLHRKLKSCYKSLYSKLNFVTEGTNLYNEIFILQYIILDYSLLNIVEYIKKIIQYIIFLIYHTILRRL